MGLALFKVAYGAVLLAALLLWGDLEGIEARHQLWPAEGSPMFLSHFTTWDAAHYLHLSTAGYQAGDRSCAFYPLWPLLLGAFAPVAGASLPVAGLLLANAFSVGAWAMFYILVSERLGPRVAKLAILLLLAFPGSLFFQFIYTESLCFFLLMLLCLALERERFALAAVPAFLLPMTRAVGLFCVFPIAWHLLLPPMRSAEGGVRNGRQRPEVGGERSDGGDQRSEIRDQEAARANFWSRAVLSRAWLLAAPLAGWAAYVGLMWHWTGNPFEGFEAQKHWRVHSITNLWDVPKFIVGFLTPTTWHAFTGSVLDRSVFLLLLYCLPLLWRLDKEWLIWTLVLGVVPAMSGTFTSFTRFATLAFPMFAALGVFLARPQRRWLRSGVLAVFAVLHVVLVWRYVNCQWAG